MPYIKREDRESLKGGNHTFKNSGELNYYIHLVITDYIEDKGFSYQTCNDILGALEGVKAEFYRRKVAPYEDEKIAENGDIRLYREDFKKDKY